MEILTAKKMKIKSVYILKKKNSIINIKELEKLFGDIRRNLNKI